jgi:flagellar hook assembly protein FlgD
VNSNVTLKIYDVIGREVSTIVNGNQQPGYYNINFDGSRLAAGIYIYKLTAGKFVSTKKLMLIK